MYSLDDIEISYVCLLRNLALLLTVKHHAKMSVLYLRKYLTINIDCNPGPRYINETPHDKTNKMVYAPSVCAQASAQSDQSLRCPHEESFGP